MATRGVGEIPSLTQLYRNPESALSQAALTSKKQPDYPASDSVNERVGLVRGDITKLRLDAIVNAANPSLQGGGGVDGAIHDAAGPGLREECKPLGPIKTGQAVITKGYNLPATHVIHTVGPIYGSDPNPKASLEKCYRESLRVAVKNKLQTVAFSAVSTGIYGFPNSSAARIACKTVREFLDSEEGSNLLRVVFITFVPPDVNAYNDIIPRFFPPAKEDTTE
ncbi:hypothetical protein FGRMN_4065 [Fusarium graminum]|nr:hypothetical protein FGRMN_4065 [Fusarium graminum]